MYLKTKRRGVREHHIMNHLVNIANCESYPHESFVNHKIHLNYLEDYIEYIHNTNLA